MKSNIYFYSVPIILFFITSCQPKKTVIELPEIEEQEVSENTEPLPQNSMIDTDDDYEDESIYLSMTGNLVSSEDTGQGPFYGVSIKNNRGNFYFWVEASSTPEVYKWELDYFDNDFNIYKDTLIHISYTEELTLEVIDVSPKGTSNSKGKFYSGTLEGMYDAGDTPGSIDLIIESGETISFRGNFDIESSPEVEQLIGEQVEIYYDIDTVRWINDLGYVKTTSQEQLDELYLCTRVEGEDQSWKSGGLSYADGVPTLQYVASIFGYGYDFYNCIRYEEGIKSLSGILPILKSASTYGFDHYNPEIIRWAADNLLPGASDTIILDYEKFTYGYIYKNEFPPIVEHMADAYIDLVENYDIQVEVDNYMEEVMVNGMDGLSYLKDKYSSEEPYDEMLKKWSSAGVELVIEDYWQDRYVYKGFWLRRHIDGTIDEFHYAMSQFLAGFNPKYYESNKSYLMSKDKDEADLTLNKVGNVDIEDEDEKPVDFKMAVMNADGKMRNGTSLSAEILLDIPKGSAVKVLGTSKDYVKIEYQGVVGYIFEFYIDESSK